MPDVASNGQNAVVIDQKDNVAVATYQLEAGAEARYPSPDGSMASVALIDDIPLFHKIALVDIPRGGRSSNTASSSVWQPRTSSEESTSTRITAPAPMT